MILLIYYIKMIKKRLFKMNSFKYKILINIILKHKLIFNIFKNI